MVVFVRRYSKALKDLLDFFTVPATSPLAYVGEIVQV
jgi:hypothetical protein